MFRITSIVVALTVAAFLVSGSVANADLLANWTFDEATGAYTADATGNGFTANSLNTDGIAGFSDPTANQAGVIGTAFKYTFKGGGGSGESLRTAMTSGSLSLAGGGNALTLSTWFYAPGGVGGGEWSLMRARIPSYSDSAYNLGIQNLHANEVRAMWFSGGSPYPEPYFGTDAITSWSDWHMLSSTYFSDATGQVTTVYLDGVLMDTVTSSAATLTAAADYVYLSGAEWGSTKYGNHWANSYQDDTGVWDETLSDAKIAAMYNTPLVQQGGAGATLGSTGHYGQLDMETLFDIFDGEIGPTAVDGTTWYSSAALPGYSSQALGSAWYDAGTGSYNVLLGDGGMGVSTVIPEPSTLALLATGLIGLLAYAWRKRK